ncbi:MAG: hypothetical protein GY861_20925 [bacterium]|nr:hypothetical protein [bacterium]
MKILITVRELFDKHVWTEFCDIRGIEYYAAEALTDDHEYELSLEQAVDLGLIPPEDDGIPW